MPLVLGITGGVGTGKSTVLRMLGGLGALTLSADDLAREVLAKDTSAYHEVVRSFGRGILAANGQVDRRALADIVFQDAESRELLNSITHPRIIRRMEQLIADFRRNAPSDDAVLAIEIPLLYECGLQATVDRVLVVAAEHQTQVDRLTSSTGISADDALKRISAQMPLADKLARADFVIRNDGDIASLERSVGRIWGQICLLRRE